MYNLDSVPNPKKSRRTPAAKNDSVRSFIRLLSQEQRATTRIKNFASIVLSGTVVNTCFDLEVVNDFPHRPTAVSVSCFGMYMLNVARINMQEETGATNSTEIHPMPQPIADVTQ